MDEIDVVQFMYKTMKERRSNVLDILENNGINTMEQYATLMGELTAIAYIEQELSNLLEKEERLND